jgi:hypothetical protein
VVVTSCTTTEPSTGIVTPATAVDVGEGIVVGVGVTCVVVGAVVGGAVVGGTRVVVGATVVGGDVVGAGAVVVVGGGGGGGLGLLLTVVVVAGTVVVVAISGRSSAFTRVLFIGMLNTISSPKNKLVNEATMIRLNIASGV